MHKARCLSEDTGPNDLGFTAQSGRFFVNLPRPRALFFIFKRQRRSLGRCVRTLLAHPGRKALEMLGHVGYLASTLAKHIQFPLSATAFLRAIQGFLSSKSAHPLRLYRTNSRT
jgi:hypothetical protein